MRLIVAAVAALAVLWSAYWVVGARTVEARLNDWFEARRAEGWVAEVGDIRVRGFPNRFDTTLSELELADPATGLAWRAPFLQILMLSYARDRAILVWPNTQQIATPDQVIEIASRDMRASLAFDDVASLTLSRLTLAFEAVSLRSERDWQASLASGQVAMRRVPETERRYELAFDATDLTLPLPLLRRLGAAEDPGPRVAEMTLRARGAFDRAWDRRAIEERRPQPERLQLELAELLWGPMELRLTGDLRAGDDGQAQGRIDVQLRDWQRALAIARASGALPADMVPLLRTGLGALAGLSGRDDTIDAPLVFRGGQVALGGFLPLGPAPPLQIR